MPLKRKMEGKGAKELARKQVCLQPVCYTTLRCQEACGGTYPEFVSVGRRKSEGSPFGSSGISSSSAADSYVNSERLPTVDEA